MANSMTGFGRANLLADGREMTVELKSVNHRYLDLSFRMPRHISFLEDDIRRLLTERLTRGHVDVFVTYRNTRDDARTVVFDSALLGAYLKAAEECTQKYGLRNDMSVTSALRMPDVMDVVEAEEDREAVTALLLGALNKACDELIGMRKVEGERLCRDLLSRLETVLAIREKIALRAPSVVEDYRLKLNERINAILTSAEVDTARLATEVALFADKANIDEELVRLQSHVAAARDLLENGAAVGRKMDFIVQEMNREFNTIGSKANDKEITALVIEGKAEIEKIREQVQNLE
ncbi:MAG: YicC family protein [Clostridiales bacterium]|nr:YicC family protein [Clostridiales bacterium]